MRYKPGKVVTEATLECSRRDAWNKVCFYEHISIRPSLLLRIVLPVPEKTTGRYERAGDISRCCYSDGDYLTKRIREIVENERVDFGIIEQSIRFHRSVKLLGGSIALEDIGGDRCVVRMVTHYKTGLKPAGLFRWAIARVVKAMHSIVIRDMQVCLAQKSHASDTVQLPV